MARQHLRHFKRKLHGGPHPPILNQTEGPTPSITVSLLIFDWVFKSFNILSCLLFMTAEFNHCKSLLITVKACTRLCLAIHYLVCESLMYHNMCYLVCTLITWFPFQVYLLGLWFLLSIRLFPTTKKCFEQNSIEQSLHSLFSPKPHSPTTFPFYHNLLLRSTQ